MPVNITISHETPEGVIQHVRALAASFDHQPVPARAEPAPPITDTVKQVTAAVADAKAEPKRRGRPPAAEKAPQISTQPENRTDPEADAQDEADEAAESGFDLDEPAKPVVRDDVRALAVAYRNKFGDAAVQEDGKKIFGFPKLSDIPDDKLAEAFANMQSAIANNPYKRAVVSQ